MNKLTKLLSVFVLAGAVGASAGALAGCGHKHSYSSEWETNTEYHWHAATCEHGDEKGSYGKHEDKTGENGTGAPDGKCDVCGYTMTPGVSGDVTAPAGYQDLIVEGVTTTYTLSDSLKAADIDLSGMHVYFQVSGQKGDEVDSDHYTAELYKGGVKLNIMTGLKEDGEYTLMITLKDVTGVTNDNNYKEVSITVNNPIASISWDESASGTVKEQTQGSQDIMSSTWKFKATRANGDEENLEATDVEIGAIDPLAVGQHQVTVTLKGTSITTTVTYTINKDENLKTQSYVINAASHTGSYTQGQDIELDSTHKVYFTNAGDKTGAVDANKKELDGRIFTHRLKVQGAYNSTHASDKGNSIKFENLNDTTGMTDGATAKTKITIYCMSGNSSQDRAISIAKEVDGELVIDQTQAQILRGDKLYKIEFEVSEKATYHIACWPDTQFSGLDTSGHDMKTGGWNVYYIQVDKMISGDTTQEDIPLEAGTDEIYELSVKCTDPEITGDHHVSLGTTWDSIKDKYEFKATFVNTVTCIAKEETVEVTDFTVPEGFTTTPDVYDVIAKYQGKEATIKIYVESDVPGVTGATVKVKSTFVTELQDASGHVTLKLSDLEGGIEGENPQAVATVLSATYVVKGTDAPGTAINDETGVSLGVGDYTITAQVKITAGSASYTFTATYDLTIKAHEDVESWLYHTTYATPDKTNAGVSVNDNFPTNSTSYTAKALYEAKAGENVDDGFYGATPASGIDKNTSDVPVLAKGEGPCANAAAVTFTNALGFSSKPGTSGKNYIEITASKDITIYVYVNLSDGKHGSNRNGGIYTYQKDSEAVQELTATVRKTVDVIKVQLTTGQKLTIGAKQGAASNDPVLWLYGIEAVATPAAAAASLQTPVAILPKKEY